ncbi:MAG: hypothetical protein PGN33_26735 [Methylobacterium radiotolerans]
MKLNHINLTSIDVAGDVAMFETYFGLRPLVMRGKALAVLESVREVRLSGPVA